MYQYINQEQMTIFGDGTQTRAFSFIDDILEPLWNAAVREQTSKQIINLGGVEEISIEEAANTLKSVIGTEDKFRYLEARHEVKHSIPTFQKSIDLLDFKFTTTLRDGLEKMWNWANHQPMQDRFVWEKYELEKGIYKFWKND